VSRTTRINRPNSPTSRKGKPGNMFWNSKDAEGKGRTYRATSSWHREVQEALNEIALLRRMG